MWLLKRFISALSLFHAFRVRDECGTPDSMTCGDIWMAGDHLLSKSLIGYRHRITHRIPHWIPHATSIQFLLDACLHIDIRQMPGTPPGPPLIPHHQHATVPTVFVTSFETSHISNSWQKAKTHRLLQIQKHCSLGTWEIAHEMSRAGNTPDLCTVLSCLFWRL